MRLKIKISHTKDIPTKGNIVAVDTETTGLKGWGIPSLMQEKKGHYPCRPFAFSFCDSKGNTHYERLEVDPYSREIIEPNKWPGRDRIQKVLGDESITKVFHNASFDIHMLKLSGYIIRGPIQDTLIMAHLITGGDEFKYGLKELGEKFLGFSKEDQIDLIASVRQARKVGKTLGYCIAEKGEFGKEPEKADYWLGDPKLCDKYAVGDVERTMLLYLLFLDEMERSSRELQDLYRVEMDLMPVLIAMEERGVRVYEKRLKILTNFYRDQAKIHYDKAVKLGFPKDANAGSPVQLAKFFFETRGHPPRYTETFNEKKGRNNYKCNNAVMYELAKDDVIANELLESRSAQYAYNSFMLPYERCVTIEEDGYWTMHPNYRQCGPITGRISATEPNMMTVASGQTFRTKSQIRMRNRELFGPRDGYVWYLPDFSQEEVWIFARLAEAEKMLEVLSTGKDFHSAIAESIWFAHDDYYFTYCYDCMKTHDSRKYDHCPHCSNTNPMTLFPNKKLYRQFAKLIMFCRLYGGGIGKVAELAGVDRSKAEQIVDDYNKALPEVAQYQERIANIVAMDGKLVNPFGRQYFLDRKSSYRGTNYMVQGTCADLMKRAMIRIHRLFRDVWKGCHLLLTLHDEIICEIPEKFHSKKLMRDIILVMQEDWKFLGLPRPIPIGMSITKSVWSEKKKIQV